MLSRLPGRGKSRQGAPMERPQGGHDDVAARAAHTTGELDRAFVGLCTGVREEHLAPCRRAVPHKTIQVTSQTLVELVMKQVRHVHQPRGLLGDRVHDVLVAVPERHHGYAGEEVQIPATLIVEQLGPPPRDETDRCRRVRRHERGRSRLRSHCATTIVPTPSLVRSSSKIAWVTLPSSTWAPPTPWRTA